MRGVIFTEFLEFVESAAGPDMVDRMIDATDPPSRGAYTSVGNYDHAELLAMLGFLTAETRQEAGPMVAGFGRHLFHRFAEAHPGYLTTAEDAFDFLSRIEDHIHVEVRKLYPEAELPSLATERPAPGVLVLHYRSTRPFADLCEGLIRGALDHFGVAATLDRTDCATEGGAASRFEIRAVRPC